MKPYLDLLRPRQWIKNVLLFAPVAFDRKLTDWDYLAWSCLGFSVFCVVSSAVYVFNDVLDHQEDRLHPVKRHRPIAAGQISPRAAVTYGLVLLLASLLGAAALRPAFFAVVLAYLLLQAGYFLLLKKKAIADVLCIASGYVLRAAAGAVLVGLDISPWLVVCTFTLCLFLGFGKRRAEIAMLAGEGNAVEHRPALAFYTTELLNHLITVSAGIAIMSFLLYTMDPETEQKFGTVYLIYTMPLVIYGIFRYAMLAGRGQATGPTEIFLSDRPSQITVILWVVLAALIIYHGPKLKRFLEVAQPTGIPSESSELTPDELVPTGRTP